MPRRRLPTAVAVIAVLHLVFGGLGLFCLGLGGVMRLAGADRSLARMGTPEQQRQAELTQRRKAISEEVLTERVPLYRAYTAANSVLTLLFCLAMIASGLGLLYLQSWARWLSVGYAAASLLANVVVFVYTVAFMAPAEAEVFRRLPPQNEQEQMAYNVARVAAPFGPCFAMIYPAAVLVVMLVPSTGRAFGPDAGRARRRRRRFEDEYDEEPDDDADEDEPPDDRVRPRRRR